MAERKPIVIIGGERKTLPPGDTIGQSAMAQGTTANPTRILNTYDVIPEMTVTLTVNGGPVYAWFNGDFDQQSNDDFDISVFLDGSQDVASERKCSFFGGSLLGLTPARIISGQGITVARLMPAAGPRTIDVRWKANAGTARASGTRRSLIVAELF